MATPRDELRACGRDPAQVPVSIAMSLTQSTARRAALGTDPGEVVRNAQAFAKLGVDTLVISANTNDPRAARAALEMVARDVVPAALTR